jgi:cob(I)alamin adenosyltransferase
MDMGLVHILTGDGPGKTTSALGMAVRAIGHGYKVHLIMFIKGKQDYGEILASKMIPRLEITIAGRDHFVDKQKPERLDFELAEKGLKRAEKLMMSGEYDMIILDCVNVALDFGLLNLREVIELIKSKPEKVELVLTGRHAPEELYEYADYVTEMKEIKHPYKQGILAREGIEY